MAEENKEQEKKVSEKLGALGKILLGVGFIILGLLAIVAWRGSLWIVIKGCIGLFLILAGAITIAIARE